MPMNIVVQYFKYKPFQIMAAAIIFVTIKKAQTDWPVLFTLLEKVCITILLWSSTPTC